MKFQCIVWVMFLLFCVPQTRSEELQGTESPIVWYIPGSNSGTECPVEEIKQIQKIYPDAAVCVPKYWNEKAMGLPDLYDRFQSDLRRTDEVAENLYEEIHKMPTEDQKRLILIGHSLGGNIVVKTLALCRIANIQIRQMILVGAAISNKDPRISFATSVTVEKDYNIINPEDDWLGIYRITEQRVALGTGIDSSLADCEQLYEIMMNKGASHDAKDYLNFFAENLQNGPSGYMDIIVAQDWMNKELTVIDGKMWWHVLKSCNGWQLQQHNITGHCRILDPDDVRRACGGRNAMTASFDGVTRQLPSNSEPQIENVTRQVAKPQVKKGIFVQQDYYNADTRTMGGNVWWDELDSEQGWRLQKNSLSGHCRILDPDGVRKAWGTEENMLKSFAGVKDQLNE